MKKRLLALLCVMALVLVPSMGVMASETDTTADNQQTTSENQQDATDSVIREGGQNNQVIGETTGTTSDETGTEEGGAGEAGTGEGEAGEAGTGEGEAGEAGTDEGGTGETGTDEGDKTGTEQGQDSLNSLPVNEIKEPVKATKALLNTSVDGSAQNQINTKADNPPVTIMLGFREYKLENGVFNYMPTGKVEDTLKGVTWDDTKKELRFENVTLEIKDPDLKDDDKIIAINIIGDSTLVLVGDNLLVEKNGVVQIVSDGNLTIKNGGEGTLTASSKHSSISVIGNKFNINNVDIVLNSSENTPDSFSQGIVFEAPGDNSSGTLTIKDSKIQGMNMPIQAGIPGDSSAMGITFSGKSVVTANGVMGSPAILATGRIFFALTADGKVIGNAGAAQDALQELPGIMSLLGFDFSLGNNIIVPKNGVVRKIESGGDVMYYIAHPSGNPAAAVTIVGTGTEEPGTKADTTVVKELKTTAKSAGSGVKTGDAAQAGLWLLLVFAAACCAAVVIRAKKVR